MASGKLGLAIGVMSYVDSIRISVTCDTAIMDKPRKILELFEEAVQGYIDLGKEKKKENFDNQWMTSQNWLDTTIWQKSS